MPHEENGERCSVSHDAHPSQPLSKHWSQTRASRSAPQPPLPECAPSPARPPHPPSFGNLSEDTRLLNSAPLSLQRLSSGFCFLTPQRHSAPPHARRRARGPALQLAAMFPNPVVRTPFLLELGTPSMSIVVFSVLLSVLVAICSS
ncbi:hypothetical protein NDU88_006609 [Pleurodeles waltl]|uniref:Uncharacterized protein n=1 Tax=Pleurodeles waltl TaxID=8319 RepID=A0AAV7MZR2_PLEWA|nr:hypothetical protein NDU88_006609 [Pleurodeles waltl]